MNFQLHGANPEGGVWEKLTTDGKYINKRVSLFIHQAKSLSGVEKKKNYSDVIYIHTSAKWLFDFF